MTREQWQAIRDRDGRYDGQFFWGSKKSKTVCRPSCAYRSRDARQIMIFSTLESALQQGYKPCGRCRPDHPRWAGPRQELARAAQAYIQAHSGEKFSLEALAGALYVNGSYLARVFRACTGQTLLHCHNQTRCEKAKALLAQNEYSISAVSDRTGFASPAHFSRIFKQMTGNTPTQYRAAYFRSLNE